MRDRCPRQNLKIRNLVQLPRPQRDSKAIHCGRRAKAERALRRRSYRRGCSCQGMDGPRGFKNRRSKPRDLVTERWTVSELGRFATDKSAQVNALCAFRFRPTYGIRRVGQCRLAPNSREYGVTQMSARHYGCCGVTPVSKLSEYRCGVPPGDAGDQIISVWFEVATPCVRGAARSDRPPA
jgi:hypothetical protein